jgi:hypothetical protein
VSRQVHREAATGRRRPPADEDWHEKALRWQGFLLGTGGIVKSFDPIAEKDLSSNHDPLWDG